MTPLRHTTHTCTALGVCQSQAAPCSGECRIEQVRAHICATERYRAQHTPRLAEVDDFAPTQPPDQELEDLLRATTCLGGCCHALAGAALGVLLAASVVVTLMLVPDDTHLAALASLQWLNQAALAVGAP